MAHTGRPTVLTSVSSVYPKAVVEKAVDDRIDEAVAHCQPMYRGVNGHYDTTGLRLVLAT